MDKPFSFIDRDKEITSIRILLSLYTVQINGKFNRICFPNGPYDQTGILQTVINSHITNNHVRIISVLINIEDKISTSSFIAKETESSLDFLWFSHDLVFLMK